MRVPVGWSGYSVNIESGWRVLDVGSGHAPNPRADVLLELMPEDDSERSGVGIDLADPRLVLGDACDMPFSDKEFDYIMATHLAEHVDDPEALCRELSRVGRAGYLETPGWFGDIIMRETFHKWRVRRRGPGLEFVEVTDQRPLGLFGDALYALIYAGRQRPGHPSLHSSNPIAGALLTAVRYGIAGLFRLPGLVDIIYLRFEWRGAIECRVVRRSSPSPTQLPFHSDTHEG